MELFGKDIVESSNFLFGEIILFSGGITDEIEEEFEESSLEVIFGIFSSLIFSKHMNNCLKSMFQIK